MLHGSTPAIVEPSANTSGSHRGGAARGDATLHDEELLVRGSDINGLTQYCRLASAGVCEGRSPLSFPAHLNFWGGGGGRQGMCSTAAGHAQAHPLRSSPSQWVGIETRCRTQKKGGTGSKWMARS